MLWLRSRSPIRRTASRTSTSGISRARAAASASFRPKGSARSTPAIGDRDLADTVLQNFRQTICFRTEDRATIERMNFLLGAVDVARISENVGTSTTSGHGSSSSAGYGLSLQRQNVITPQLFRQLRQNDALALLSIGGNAYDDVLTMPPVYV